MSDKYIIEKTITRKYEVTDIARFLKYGVFADARKNMKDTPKTCFRCHHKFDGDEYTYLGMVRGDKNRIFCESCAKHIAEILGKKDITKLTYNE